MHCVLPLLIECLLSAVCIYSFDGLPSEVGAAFEKLHGFFFLLGLSSGALTWHILLPQSQGKV